MMDAKFRYSMNISLWETSSYATGVSLERFVHDPLRAMPLSYIEREREKERELKTKSNTITHKNNGL